MKEQIQKLWELQGLEQRQKAAAQRRENVNSEEVHSSWQEVQRLSRQLAAERQKLETLKKACNAKEEQVNGVVGQLKALEKRLYSGELTHAKEMEQIKTKCEGFQRDINIQENALFEVMEMHESLSEHIKALEMQNQERKQQHSRKQQELAAHSKQAEQDADSAADACRVIAEGIDPAFMDIYQKLKGRIANPVAKLENGICLGCRMSAPTRQASGQAGLAYCDNCGRILLQ